MPDEQLVAPEPPLPVEAIPPCIRAIHLDLANGVNVKHRGRMAFASFMLMLGVDEGTIARQYSRSPNFNESKTKSQVKSLRGMLPQSCKTMQAEGLCTEMMKESLCRSIRNPISWGRIRTGTVVPGPRIEDNANVTYTMTCACGKRLGPIVGAEAAHALAKFHFWSIPVDEEDLHLTIEYETTKPAGATAT